MDFGYILSLVCCRQLRSVLSGMEYRLRSCCSPPAELQQWLQLTYEIETRYFERKRLATDTQLKAAKDMVGSRVSLLNFVVLCLSLVLIFVFTVVVGHHHNFLDIFCLSLQLYPPLLRALIFGLCYTNQERKSSTEGHKNRAISYCNFYGRPVV